MPDTVYPSNTSELAQKRRELSPDTELAFQAFSKKVFAEGALPAKVKQIIAVAVATLPNALTASRDTRRRRCGMALHKKN